VADVQELVRQGIEAAREGKKAAARDFFERAVELDSREERAWFWLASVSDTDEEKRICLERVLEINPGNTRAQQALDKIEAQDQDLAGSAEMVSGMSNRSLAITVGVGVLVIALIVLVFVFLTARQNQIEAENARQTQVAASNATATESQIQAEIAAITATAIAEAPPSGTPLPPRNTLPPPFTPIPSPTDPADAVEVLPPPQGLTGVIAGWAGVDFTGLGYLEVGVFDVTTGEFQRVGNNVGRDVRVVSSGGQIIYTRFGLDLSDLFIELVNFNGTLPTLLADQWRGYLPVLQPRQPHMSADGQFTTFVALDQEDNVVQVYTVSMDPLPPNAATSLPNPRIRLTSDDATYSFPVFSPDGTRIVTARDFEQSANPGADLVVIDAQNGNLIAEITTDLGAYIETQPRWSPDGSQVIFSAAPQNDPENGEIFIRNADGTGAPIVLPALRSDGNDIWPVYSPDGRHVAFSSNRNGEYEIYIFDIQNDVLSQLTNTPNQPDYVTDWWQSQ
jgi:hypothetical protein